MPDYAFEYFVSRRGGCAAVAQEVADVLTGAGYAVTVQDYDFALNDNFVLNIHDALTAARHLVLLLTEDYDTSPYTRAEFASFWAMAQSDPGRRIVFLRVEDCVPRGLFAGQTYADLAVLDDPAARRAEILKAAQGQPPMLRPEAPVMSGVPAENLRFVGRGRELARLYGGFLGGGEGEGAAQAITQAALHGLGGIGKTSLAVAYARRYGFEYSGVGWLDAETEAGLIESLARFGEALDPQLAAEPDMQRKAERTLRLIERRTGQRPVLLVYDNLPGANALAGWTPARGAHVLVTSRAVNWGGAVHEVRLGVLSQAEAVALLLGRTWLADEPGASVLADALGHLPLALEQAAATIALEGESFESYAARLEMFLDQGGDNPDYPRSVAATVRQSLASAESREPLSRQAMAMLSRLAPEPVPLAVLDAALGLARGGALRALQSVSLIDLARAGDGAFVTVHRVVQAVLRHDDPDPAATQTAAIAAIYEPFPEDVETRAARELALTLAPHALVLAESPGGSAMDQWKLGIMSSHAGSAYVAAGLGKAARDAFERSRDICQSLSEADPGNAVYRRNLSVSLNKLGDLAVAEGDGAAAREAFELSRDIRQRLSEADPGNAGYRRDLSVSLIKLGDLAVAEGDGAAARDAFERSRGIFERLSEADPGNAGYRRDLSVSLERLGDLAIAEGDGKAAREAFELSRDIAQSLSEADPGNAGYRRDLSVLLDKLGDLAVAEGDGKAAREAFELSRDIRQSLSDSDPGNAVYRRDLIVSLVKLAEAGDEPSARYGEALTIAKQLAADERLAGRDRWMVADLQRRLDKAGKG